MMEGLSFTGFRRVATMRMVPRHIVEYFLQGMISISSVDLSDAQRNDASAPYE